MADQLGSDQKQLEANLALLQLDGVDVDVVRNMIVGTPSREGELGVAEDSQTGDFSGMSFISNGTEIAVTGGKADVSGISGEISLQGYQYGAAIPDTNLDHFYWSQELSAVDPWPDEEGTADASAIGDPQLDGSGINSEQAVLYDGTDDGHQTSSAFGLGSNSEWTAACVFQLNDNGSTQTLIENGDIGTDDGYRLAAQFDNNQYRFIHSGVTAATGGTPDTNAHVLVVTYDGSNIIADLDGSEIVNSAVSGPNSPTSQFAIGFRSDNATFVDGHLGAAGHEAAAADATRRDELTNKLAEPFGISVST